MKINCLPLGHIHSNCYMLETHKAAVVIDPGFISEEVLKFLVDNKEKERLILLTHCHFDHVGGAEELRKKADVKIAISKIDEIGLHDREISLANRFHAKQPEFFADILLEDNAIISVSDISVRCMLTPGHTKGGMCFLIENHLFAGDTLFNGSIGRTDHDFAAVELYPNSLKRLTELDDYTVVYPGHGEATTIIKEKQNNYFLRGII